MDRWMTATRAWRPGEDRVRLLAVDVHTEGEPLRVVLGGLPEIQGNSMLARRRWARDNLDHLRTALMWEPRGHADMYGALVVPPVTEAADVGVLFIHNDGFSTMCGHGIIGLATVLLELSLLDMTPDDRGTCRIGIDTPAGFVEAAARIVDGAVEVVSFRNVPSFVARREASVEVDGLGPVRYDLAYGGAFYAYVDADDFDLRLVPAETARLVDLGRRIKEAIQAADPPSHPDDADLGFLYGTIFVGPAHTPEHHSRNVCVFADGEVDRCPTGTGVSGRLALHHDRGEVEPGERIVVEGILGTCFEGCVEETTRVGSLPAVVPRVAGGAWITGRNELLLDPSDPLAHGFLLR